MRPWNIAHRGGAQLRPENTLAAFACAVAKGCDGAELDVQLSRDGEVVVFHDYRLKPDICRDEGRWLSPPTPRLKDLSLAELRRYDVGRADPQSAYARAHPGVAWQDGECIPTLDEVVAVAKTAPAPFRLFVELKTCFSDRDASALPEDLAERAVAVLTAHGYLDRTIFVGFDWPGLLHAKKIAPSAQCWFTTLPQSWFRDGVPPPEDDPPSEAALQMLRYWAREGISPWAGGFDAVKHGGSIVAAIRAAGGDGWFPARTDIDAQTVAEARGLGLKVGAWTVNDPAEMRALATRGLDAICTDRPDLLAKFAHNPSNSAVER
ncbi:MAG: glycerophosphodiester phosphodiesterase [Alphaproteobacteria bacterium]|nr:glycerophosphodiester phosphodiesterase [Alphaproteobacteria bacterium]MDE2629730.1 glycerophosphodiester phosphodiesterase [Alphaproteobacteria bacterium]